MNNQNIKFANLPSTRKGDAGERVAIDYLRKRNNFVYTDTHDAPHPIDLIVINPKKGLRLLVDVKTYPRLYTTESTGIDAADYVKYVKLERDMNTPVFLMFVDVWERAIYGAYLNQLSDNVQKKGKVYFRLTSLNLITDLSADQLANLSPIKQPERYKNVKPFFGVRLKVS